MNIRLHATYLITIIFLIFALSLRTYEKTNIMDSLKESVKRLQSEQRRHEEIEKKLLSKLEKDSLLLVSIKKERDKTKVKRKKNEDKIDDIKTDIASTDSITDLLIGANIIRESNKERLSDR